MARKETLLWLSRCSDLAFQNSKQIAVVSGHYPNQVPTHFRGIVKVPFEVLTANMKDFVLVHGRHCTSGGVKSRTHFPVG